MITFEGGSKVLHPGSLLPIKAPRTKVLCYSVFSPTRWVTRALTSHELERCYDMHDHQLQYWKDVPISSIPTTGLPFHGSVPLRLTHALGDLIFAQSSYGDSQQNHEVAPMEATPHLPTVGAIPSDSGDQDDAGLLWGENRPQRMMMLIILLTSGTARCFPCGRRTRWYFTGHMPSRRSLVSIL